MTEESKAIASLVDRFPLRVRLWILEKTQGMAEVFFRYGIGVEDDGENVVRLHPVRHGTDSRR